MQEDIKTGKFVKILVSWFKSGFVLACALKLPKDKDYHHSSYRTVQPQQRNNILQVWEEYCNNTWRTVCMRLWTCGKRKITCC